MAKAPQKSAPRAWQLALLAATGLAAVYAKSALGPLQETMRLTLNLSDNEMALLQGPALALPILLAAIPLGLLIDRGSRARLILILSILLIAGTIATALAPSFLWLFLARSVVGLAVLALIPAGLSFMSDLYKPAERGRATTVLLICQFAGLSIVFAVGGWLVDAHGDNEDGWRFTLMWLAAPLLLTAALAFFLREPRRHDIVHRTQSATVALREAWRYREFVVPIMIGKVATVMALQATLTWAAPTLARKFALSPADVGFIIAVIAPLGGIGGTILGGMLADLAQKRGGPSQTVGIMSLVVMIGAPLGAFGLVSNLWLGGAMLAFAVGLLTAASVMAAIVLLVAIPNEVRGLVTSVVTGVSAFLTVGFAPVIVSLSSAALGGEERIGLALAIVVFAGAGLGAIAFAFSSRLLASRSFPASPAQSAAPAST